MNRDRSIIVVLISLIVALLVRGDTIEGFGLGIVLGLVLGALVGAAFVSGERGQPG